MSPKAARTRTAADVDRNTTLGGIVFAIANAHIGEFGVLVAVR